MSVLLARTHDALKVERLHSALAVRRPSDLTKDEPCVGAKMAALRCAITDLMSEDDEALGPEAREIVRLMNPLGFRCRNIWRES